MLRERGNALSLQAVTWWAVGAGALVLAASAAALVGVGVVEPVREQT